MFRKIDQLFFGFRIANIFGQDRVSKVRRGIKSLHKTS